MRRQGRAGSLGTLPRLWASTTRFAADLQHVGCRAARLPRGTALTPALAPTSASRARCVAWLAGVPLRAGVCVFFLVPLLLTVMVSFWNYNEYEMIPAFTLRNYVEIFEGCCGSAAGDLCVTFKTYLSTLQVLPARLG